MPNCLQFIFCIFSPLHIATAKASIESPIPIKKIDKYANNDNLNKWYGLCLNIKNSKGKSSPVRVDALEDKLIVYCMNKFRINTFEIEYNKIKRYDLYEDFVYISYDDKRFMYTIIENDVSKFNNIICGKIGYNSKKYNELNKIISEAFIEYDVFNNSSSKKDSSSSNNSNVSNKNEDKKTENKPTKVVDLSEIYKDNNKKP